MEMSKEVMADNLEILPEQIRNKEVEFNENSAKYDELILRQKTIETNKSRAILNEINSDGKKTFSNQDQRNVELAKRLKDDQEYQLVMNNMTDVKEDIDSLKLALEFLKRRFRSFEAISRLGVF